MPRPKVLPENRQRSSRACQPCRASKKKCDGSLPCSNCAQRNIRRHCTFGEKKRHFDRHEKQSSISERNASSVPQRELGETGYPSTSETNNTTLSPDPPSELSTLNRTGIEPAARMLQNSDGEKVFVGSHGSLAFLQSLRTIVSRHIGVSEFSHNADRDMMLEAELISGWQFDVQESLLKHQNLEEIWVDSFLTATNGLMDVLDRDEALELIRNSDAEFESAHPLRYATKMMIISIGIQCSSDEGEPLLQDQAFFMRARQAAFASFLENSCPDMVRVFLLMSFYMLGACRRNTATMYLGVAGQAAHILGLHNPDLHKPVGNNQTDDRFRLWKSLVSFDMIVNSILARPLSISPPVSNLTQLSPSNLLESATKPLDTTYKLSLIIRKNTAEQFEKMALSVDLAECQLKNLKLWSTSLPESLRLSSVPECPPREARSRVIGSLHISCFYYFSVIVITRPFLIPFLVSHLGDEQHFPKLDMEAATSEEAKLAHTCLNAAIYMIQTCSEVMDNGYLLRNMCIMKAWIFAAALVVGLQLFLSIEPDVEAEEAFSKSRTVLQVLAKASPQAAHYLRILNFLDDAIKRQHQPKTPQRQVNADLLLNRIMQLDTNVPVAYANDLNDQSLLPPNPQFGASSATTFDIEAAQGFQSFDDCLDFNWDEDIVRFWDFQLIDGTQS